MRFRMIGAACLLVVASATSGSAAYVGSAPVPPTEIVTPQRHFARISRFFSIRSIAAQIDNQVIANLLVDAPARPNTLPLTVASGEIARCEARVCQVPLTVRVADAQGPITVSFAVANPKGVRDRRMLGIAHPGARPQHHFRRGAGWSGAIGWLHHHPGQRHPIGGRSRQSGVVLGFYIEKHVGSGDSEEHIRAPRRE